MGFEATSKAIGLKFKTDIETDGAGLPTQYDNADFAVPDRTLWCRHFINYGDSFTITFGADTNVERTLGIMVAQLRGPLNKGDKDLLVVADKIKTKFTNKTIGGLVFRSVSVGIVGQENDDYVLNVSVPFQSDELI